MEHAQPGRSSPPISLCLLTNARRSVFLLVGTALVAAQLQKRQDLICNTMQATLLLRFNRKQDDGNNGINGGCADDPALSVQQLVEDLRLDELTVKKLLGSLMLGRFKILKKVGRRQ